MQHETVTCRTANNDIFLYKKRKKKEKKKTNKGIKI